jgi:hypothetical protein
VLVTSETGRFSVRLGGGWAVLVDGQAIEVLKARDESMKGAFSAMSLEHEKTEEHHFMQ